LEAVHSHQPLLPLRSCHNNCSRRTAPPLTSTAAAAGVIILPAHRVIENMTADCVLHKKFVKQSLLLKASLQVL
jgi:hypothetical protein